jgi:hypothetical protein
MRRRIIILGTVVLVVIVAWTAGWLYLAAQVRSGIEGLAAADGVTTPRVTCGTLNVAGFPFRLDVTCTAATLISADTTASLNELRASVQVDNPFHLRLFAHAPLELSDAFTGARSRFDWQSLEASARLADWRVARISVVAQQPAWTDTLAGETPIANAVHAEFHLVDIPQELDKTRGTAALAAFSTVTGLVAPGLAINNGEGTLEANISGLPDDVRVLAADPDPLRNWQARGGSVELVGLRGHDADHSLEVSGTLALDAGGTPDGQLTIVSKGVIDQLGPMVPDQLRPLVLGTPAADGTTTQVLTMKGGVVLSGIMPVGMLPALW